MQTAQPESYGYVSPLVVNKDQEEKVIKKQSKTVALILGCIIIVLCLLITIAAFFIIKNYFPNVLNPGQNTDNTSTTPTQGLNKISDYSDIQYNQDYITRNLPTGVNAYRRPQIDLVFRIFQLAEQKQWDGNLSSQLGFTYKDFDQEFNSLVGDYKNYQKGIELTTEMEALLLGGNSQVIESYLKEGRADYISIVNSLGIDQKYTNEIDAYVLPDLPERITYLSDNYDSNNYIGSSADPLNGDYGRRVIKIDPKDIYSMYQDLVQSMFGQTLTQADLIKASTKAVLYHQMGYVLEQAFVNLHVPAEIKRLGSADMWQYSDVDFMAPSEKYFWAWQYNKQISDERLAQGLMLKCIYQKYNLNSDYQSDLYDFVVQKDNYNMNTIYSLGTMLHGQYSRLLLSDWGGLYYYLLPYFTSSEMPNSDTELIGKMLKAVNDLPYYIGHFNPEVEKDWQYLKQ